MGICQLAGAFDALQLTDKVNAGAKPSKCASANNEHNVVLITISNLSISFVDIFLIKLYVKDKNFFL